MKSANKTKDQLLKEIELLKAKVAKLKISESRREQADETLRKSEERLSKTMLAAIDGMWDWDLKTNEVYFDPRYYLMAGYDVDEFPHHLDEFQRRLHPDDLANVMNEAVKYLRGETERFIVEFRFRTKNGAWLWIIGRGLAERDESGKPYRFLGTHTDISDRKLAEEKVNEKTLELEKQINKSEEQRIAALSLLSDLNETTKELQSEIYERKQAEELLQKSEEHFRLTFRTSPDAFIISRLENGLIVDVNQGFCDITGYAREDVLGKLPKEVNLWADLEDRARFVKELTLTGQVKNMEFKFRMKNRHIVHALMSARTIDLNGVGHMLSIAKSIEELKSAEREIIQSKNTAERYLNISAEIILSLDTQGNITLLNESGHKLLGYENKTLIGKNWFETCLPKTIQPETRKFFKKLMRNEIKDISNYENEVVTRNGTKKIIGWHNTILKDDSGLITGILSSGEDVTKQKVVEKALQESELKVRSILNAMDDLVFVLDHENRFISVYASNQNLHTDKETFIGKTHAEVMPAYINELFETAMHEVKLGNTSGYEYYFNMADGSVSWYALNLSPMISEDKYIGLVAVARNITKRKLAEEFLKQSEKRLRDLSNYLDIKYEDEKKEIAKEIHDGLGQLLTGLKMDLQWIAKKWPEESSTLKNKFLSMNNIIDIGVKEVRKLSIQLRPKMLDDLGLLETLKSEIANFEERTGIDCNILFIPDEFEIEHHRSSTIYRVLMELLTNVYRHANATMLDIVLEKTKNCYIFTVIDNGVGITQDQIEGKSSFGLLSIKERISIWNGSIDILGKPNKGTTVKVTVPL